MDTSDLITEYSEQDFALAVRQLLPAGQYWQDVDNLELSNLIAGMGAEFKIVHDEVQLALLDELKGQLFGWRISDYQALLIECDALGAVYDNLASPNLIFVSLAPNERSEKAWLEFEKVRLPHTSIEWLYNATINVQTQIANARHIRNVHKYEVTQ